jgi:formylmethanofuran dehydrogenase subunit C
MKSMILSAAVVATVAGSGTAMAAGQCNIVGKFTDSLGSKGKFTSETKGTVDNTSICAKPYALTVTKLTEKVIDVTGKSADKSCGALKGDFKFQDGGCTSAAGTVTITGLGSFADTITRSGKLDHRPAADVSALTSGFK